MFDDFVRLFDMFNPKSNINVCVSIHLFSSWAVLLSCYMHDSLINDIAHKFSVFFLCFTVLDFLQFLSKIILYAFIYFCFCKSLILKSFQEGFV